MKMRADIEKYIQIETTMGSEAYCFCPFHDNKNTPSFQINMESGFWLCFTCKTKTGKPLGGTLKMLADRLGKRYTEPAMELEVLKHYIDKPPKVEQPILEESYLQRYRFPCDYWYERGMLKKTITKFDLGFDPISDIATIPYRDTDGHLLGVIQRRIGGGYPKYKFPKGFNRSSSLFASWMLEDVANTFVVITEGAVDCMKVWQSGTPAVAQYGSSLNRGQVKLLSAFNFQCIVLFYDNDKAGHNATLEAMEAFNKNYIVRPVRYPKGFPSDPGAMTSKQILRMVGEALS